MKIFRLLACAVLTAVSGSAIAQLPVYCCAADHDDLARIHAAIKGIAEGIAELQDRIQAEQAQLPNQQTKTASQKQIADAEKEQARNQQRTPR